MAKNRRVAEQGAPGGGIMTIADWAGQHQKPEVTEEENLENLELTLEDAIETDTPTLEQLADKVEKLTEIVNHFVKLFSGTFVFSAHNTDHWIDLHDERKEIGIPLRRDKREKFHSHLND
jgi:hypothetical protein